jgi:hypothetical protein
MSYYYYMANRVSSGKAKKSPKIKRVHYAVIVLSSLILAVVVTAILLPVKNSGVLSARVIAKGDPGSSGGEAGSHSENGVVHVGKNRADGTTITDIDVKHEKGDTAELNGSNGQGNNRFKNILERLKDRFHDRKEKKASESGEHDEDDIIVASESGERVKLKKNRREKILVLPEKAVAALLRNGIIQQVASTSGSASGSGAPVVIYTRTNGSPVYIVAGSKDEKLFGAIPVHLDKTVTVSAETGEIISTKQSFVNRILDLLSF